jgi:hypothetical protein
MVQSDTFDEAMSAVAERFTATPGDRLEIGVFGFPPARYMCVGSVDGDGASWRPVDEKAA